MITKKASSQCPTCGDNGRSVTALTVSSHLGDKAKAGLNPSEGYKFCPNGNCEVSYFGVHTFWVSDILQPIFQKSTDPQRLVCYCFNHSVAEIEAEILATGKTDVLASIRDNCKKGLDECEKNNPQGSCCLGNVTRVIKGAPAHENGQKLQVKTLTCCEPSIKSK